MKRPRRSTLISLILTAYLAVMAWIGRGEFLAGNYLYYFGLIIITLLCIFLLNRLQRKKEDSRPKK